MNYQSFVDSLSQEEVPNNFSVLLQSMWYAKKDQWEAAHNIAQDIPSKEGSWIHAYLHRVEGDIWNADYWYRRAGKDRPSTSLEQEWEDIVKALLEKEN